MPPLHPDELDSAAELGARSPGAVQNEEVLLRELYKPHHFDRNGNLHKRAFTVSELADGFSLHRKQYTTRTFVEQAIRKRLDIEREEPWTFAGFAVFTAAAARLIQWHDEQKQEHQAFIVKDTARRNHQGHASLHDIIDVDDPDKHDAYIRELRSEVFRLLFGSIRQLDDVYQ